MDPLSLSLTMVGLLPVIASAIRQTKALYTDVSQAKALVQELMDELTALQGNLVSLTDLLESDAINAKGMNFDQSSVLVSCSKACKLKLESLCHTLERYAGSRTRRLAWPLAQKECKESLQVLRNFAFWIQLSLSVEGCHLLSRSSADVSQTLALQFRELEKVQEATAELQRAVEVQTRILKDSRREQQRREVLDWISEYDHAKRHLEAKGPRVENTGHWIVEHPSFATWRDDVSSPNVLWSHGLPGSGKTVLTSVVVDHLLSLSGPAVSVSYFYLKYLDQGSLTLSTVLNSLLRQSVYGTTEIPNSIMELFLSHREGSKITGTADQLRLLSDVAADPRISYIVIDALDEYDHKQRRGLLNAIRELSQCRSIRLLLTSRSHIPDIEAAFSYCPQILVEAHDGDLKAYMQHEILEQNHYDIIDDEFANHIMDQFIERAHATFLPVVLQLGTVLRKETRGHMEDAIGSISDDLAVVFDETMARIDQLHEDYRVLAKRILAWLTHAKSTLTDAELGDALSVADSVQRGLKSWNTRYRPSSKMMINCCQGLVVLEPVTNRLSLAHYTVQEHFEKHTERLFPWAKVDFARTCVSYLMYEDFASSGPCSADEDIHDRVRKYPFLRYAARFWGDHVAVTEREPGVADLLSTLLGQRKSTAVAWQVVRYVLGYRQIYWRPEEGLSATPIHIACEYGLNQTLKRLLATDDIRNINLCTSQAKTTPVILAASETNVETLNLLLQAGADPYISNWYGNALHCACEAGMSDNIRLLVKFGMKPTAGRTKRERPPIICTVDSDRLGALKTLVELVDSDENNAHGGSDLRPLQFFLLFAVGRGAHDIVRLMLEHEQQHHRQIELLLRSRYVDSLLEKIDLNAGTPLLGIPVLQQAIRHGDVEMVRLLVSFGADPYIIDEGGKTAVDYAAESGISAFTDALGIDPDELTIAVLGGREDDGQPLS